MKHAAAVAVLLAAAALPLAAQRGAGGAGGRVTRGPAATGFPTGRFLDPVTERQAKRPAHAGPIPFPSGDKQWLRIETPRFIVISAIGERSSRAVAHDLEKLTAFLTRTSAYFRTSPQKTRVFLFEERANAQPYFDAVGGARVDASGITLRHPRGSTMLVDSGVRGGVSATPRHELVHDLLQRNERTLPLWLEEGLAEYYSNAGLPIREHVSRLRGRLKVPLEEILHIRNDSLRAWTFDFYAQSWAMVATLMRRDPRAFFDFLRDVERGGDQENALRERYQLTLRDLEVAMRKAGAPVVALTFEDVAVTLDITPMHRSQLLYELGEMLSRLAGREEDAERHLRAAIEGEPGNASMLLTCAEVLLVKPERAAEARELAQRAAEREGEGARAEAVIALSYWAEGDKRAARERLERAYESAPNRTDLAFPLFTLYVESGERSRADSLFLTLSESEKGNDARRLLLRAEIPRADALAREGKLREAAQILRELAPKMPGKTRANLEAQAASLEAQAQ